ncbi:MAG: DegV family protein [Thermoflexales bacterium]
MSKPNTRILTDSAALIDLQWARERGVTVMQHRVIRDGATFLDGADPWPGLAQPTTGVAGASTRVDAAPLEDYESAFQQLARSSNDIVAILSSSALSPAVSRARRAAAPLHGSRSITIVDTRHVGLGVEILVRAATELAEQGADAEAIALRVRGLRQRVYAAFASEDLMALSASGILRPAQGHLGSLLNIVPIITIEEGRLAATEKVRSIDRAIERLCDFGAEFETLEEALVLHAARDPDARARSLARQLQQAIPGGADVRLRQAGYYLSEALGPSGIGLMIYSSRVLTD